VRITSIAIVITALLAPACAGTQRANENTASLRTIVVPANAVVQVDEQFAGSARALDKRPLAVRPGKHRVTVEAPGFFPHDLEVDLAPGVTTVEVKLRKTPL